MPGPRRGIVPGQFVTEDKLEFARQLRRELTPQEKKLWVVIRGRRLGGFKFRRQQVIDGFIADFYCDETGVALELDGEVHHNQVEYDAHRDQVIASRGLVVVRISNDRIDGAMDEVMREVLELCRQRHSG